MNIGYWLGHGASSIWQRATTGYSPLVGLNKKQVRFTAVLEVAPGARESDRYRISVSAILSN